MWKAVLVVCSIGSPDKCETWVDAIGPSKTYEACIDRALETFPLKKEEWGVNVQPYSGSLPK